MAGPARRTRRRPGGEIRDGAWTAELDGDVLKGRPRGMRLIVRKERPHPGAQLRFTDADRLRLTCFAANTTDVPIATLELRHRQRARAEDRIRPPGPAGCGTCLSTTPRGTRSGWRSSSSPSTCRPGCRSRPDWQTPPLGAPTHTRCDSRATGLPITDPTGRNGPPENPTARHEVRGWCACLKCARQATSSNDALLRRLNCPVHGPRSSTAGPGRSSSVGRR